MNEKIRKKFDKVGRWIPSVVRICFSLALIGAVKVYTHNDVAFITYFSSIVSIMLLCYMFEFIFIATRLERLERGKNER